MAKMSVEEWVEKLKAALGEDLGSVVLYGSAAAEDQAGEFSDTNLLVVTKRLGVDELRALSDVVVPWVKQGNSPPVVLLDGEISASADVFPIEFSDLEDGRKVIYGEDPLAGLRFSTANLRVEIEHEFRGAVLRLRRALLATGMDKKAVGGLMMKSASTFLVLLRSAVRLTGQKPPLKKAEALAMLKARVDFDDEVLRWLDEARRQGTDPREAAEMLERYLKVLDVLSVWIDGAGA